jgi:glutamate---cysteine ligase / carboxylate-amine ligase
VIDLDAAQDVFAVSQDLTVGLEEEFGILDPETLDLVQGFEPLRDAALEDRLLAESVAGELISSEIEIRSGRGETIEHALERQREHRRRLFALAARQGFALSSTGTHPWADYRDQKIIDTEHYRRVEEGLRWVAWRNNTFSLHVHVGVRDADRAVRVCDRLRPVLPLLLAVSSSSPFLDGRDSGLHSVRSQIFTKSFPRCGVPDAYGSWASYRAYLEALIRTNSIVEYTQVWWSVRPHLTFGTVEVRICDAQVTAEESEALARLIVACVAQAARDIDEGVPFEHPAPRMVEENMWRAIRHGTDGQMIDLDRLEEYPSAAIADRLLAWTEPVRGEHGIEPRLPERNGTQRQRELLSGVTTLREVWADTVRATAESYGAGIPASPL